MKKFVFSFAGLILTAGAAHAQDSAAPPTDAAPPPDAAAPAEPAPPADAALPSEPAPPADAAPPADPAADSAAPPADATVTATADVTEAEIDSFAKATVKLQEIQADTTIAPEQKQTAMAAAVSDAGLDPAKYNEIGRAAQSDAELRAKVQTAMSKYVSPAPSEG
jgi:hypothetical protein